MVKISFWNVLPIICIVLVQRVGMHQIAHIRGGLLFEKPLAEAVMINPSYRTYVRPLDLTPFETASNNILSLIDAYDTFCTKLRHTLGEGAINNTDSSYDYNLRLIPQVVYANAKSACMKIGGRLPEVRHKHEHHILYKHMMTHNIRSIPAGVWLDVPLKTLRYLSDDELVTSWSHLQVEKKGKTTRVGFDYLDNTYMEVFQYERHDVQLHLHLYSDVTKENNT